jgi:hypothetical protein
VLELTRAVDGQVWVIEPARAYTDSADAKVKICLEMARAKFNLVSPNIEGASAFYSLCSFPNVEEVQRWDFGLQFKLKHGLKENVIYIESLSEHQEAFEGQYLLVILTDGKIRIDTVVDEENVRDEILALHEFEELAELDRYTVKTYGLSEDVVQDLNVDSVLFGDVAYLNESLSESYTLSDDFIFVTEADIGDRLKPKGMLLRWLLPCIVALVSYLIFAPDDEINRMDEIVTVTVDKFKDYRVNMTELLPQASNRFAQDYNNHINFDQFTRGWVINSVTHTPEQAVVYSMENQGGSVRELRSIVETLSKKLSIPGVIDVSRQGLVIVFEGANVPVYEIENVQLWDVREAFETLNDAITLLIPSAATFFKDFKMRDKKNKKWKSMRINIAFKRMPISELTMLTQITKNMPITISQGSYNAVDGLVTGSFELEIHGEER